MTFTIKSCWAVGHGNHDCICPLYERRMLASNSAEVPCITLPIPRLGTTCCWTKLCLKSRYQNSRFKIWIILQLEMHVPWNWFYMNYNTVSGHCSIGHTICASLTNTPNIIMTRFYPKRDECVEWVTYTINPHPDGLVTMLTEVSKQFDARVQYQSAIVQPTDKVSSWWTTWT